MMMRRIGSGLRLAGLALVPWLVACAGGGAPASPAPEAEREAASSEAGAHAAVAGITAADMARHIGVLAHDSMAGRDTPSPELEAAAEYIAERFRSLGLEPAGDSGTYIHRWDWQVARLSNTETTLAFEGSDQGLAYGEDFFLVPGMQPVEAEAVYVGRAGEDRPTAEARGKVVVFEHPVASIEDPTWQQTLMAALQPTMMTGAAGMVVILHPDIPDEVVGQLAGFTAGQTAGFPVAGLTAGAGERLLAGAGNTLSELRSAEGPTALGAKLSIRWARTTESLTPPNVVAMLPGSDPELRDTYVVLTAHFDHVGIGSPDETGDSIYNGADDDASGTAAVMEMAEAFASLDTAPARSVIFLAVSGEEDGLLGSTAYAGDPPVIDIADVVANVNMDMIGRNAPDTVIGIGQEYSTLQGVLDEIQEHHPELGLNVILDPAPEKNFFFRSDQLAFIQQGIPAVFFTTDDHEDYHKPSDEPEKIDADKAARIARLGFLLAYHIAQDPTAPEWTQEGRARVEQMLGQ